MRAAIFAPALLAGLLFAAACLETQEDIETQDIVSAIPWPDAERAEYVILDREGGEQLLRGTLAVEHKGNQYELSLAFAGRLGDKEGTDESVVLVDDHTLKPVSVRREQVLDGKSQKAEAEYDAEEGVVTITEIKDSRRRPIPLRLKDHYYDNDSALFLWRTIAFREGYEATYRTVITGSATLELLELVVVGKEEVTVPAGTFQTWRLEIRSERVRQVAWYADTPSRPLVQYDNSQQLFQLTALPTDGSTDTGTD
jgi:hypothetical protein